MQQIDRVDVLTTQLAETDRRALSQAWYSALHLAERSPHGQYCSAARSAAQSPVARQPAAGSAASCHANPAEGAAAPQRRAAAERTVTPDREAAHHRVAAVSNSDRRAPKTALARQLERTLIGRGPRGAATSFALRAGIGRVQLLVRSDGTRTRVVALCTASVRERVERALAQARFALAGHGVAAEVA
jgi:hypothetical protein